MLTAFVAMPVFVVLAAPAAGSFTSGRHDGRTYRLYVPARARAGPLIVALHGCWQTPEDFAVGTRLNEAAEQRGLAVLYPAQGRGDNAYRCWNWFAPDGGETSALLALARTVRSERGPRDGRVVVVGFSAGGFMAVNLACADPTLVAGVGVAAGGPFRCASSADTAVQCMRGARLDGPAAAAACLGATGARRLGVRASLWHGAADTVVNPQNLAALETMFARAAGAASALTEARDGTVYAVHRDARGAPLVEAWLVPGMGHAWSGGDARGTHTWPPGPDATARMLDFLLAADSAARAR